MGVFVCRRKVWVVTNVGENKINSDEFKTLDTRARIDGKEDDDVRDLLDVFCKEPNNLTQNIVRTSAAFQKGEY